MPSCTCHECRRDALRYDRYGVPLQPVFDADGYDEYGYDENGFNRDGYDSDGYNDEGYDRSGYDNEGYDAEGFNSNGHSRDYDSGRELLRNYSYTPTLIFRGDSTGSRTPFYGMEIEITSDMIGRLVTAVDETAGDLIYCKEDGSVQGAELVTHPMTYAWAMENFPWDLLPKLRDEADATVVPSDNGIHIHVSRDGFDNAAHLYKWLKLWYRNPNDMQRLARRHCDQWAAFSPYHRESHKDHVKYGKPNYNRREDGTRERYSAINTTNDATLEIRVFASTLRPQRAKAALQLVAASVEYTRQLSADAIAHRRGWEWKAFMAWASKSGLYPDLVAENRVRKSL